MNHRLTLLSQLSLILTQYSHLPFLLYQRGQKYESPLLLINDENNTSNDKAAAGLNHRYEVDLDTFTHIHSTKEKPGFCFGLSQPPGREVLAISSYTSKECEA